MRFAVHESANGSVDTAGSERDWTWNNTRTSFPRDRTVAELFEETVAIHHASVAVVLGSQQLTYGELNARANRLAHQLRHMGVGPETMVGCCIERSLELIVALIAILKAGGAYVPLDPAYPKKRFDFILADTRATVMLTQKSLASMVQAERPLPCLFVDEPNAPSFISADATPVPVGGPTSLAYVMYTSGSTGRPKGVMIENRAIVRLVRDTNFCHFGSDEVFLLFAPISFDASTLELWGPLLNGGRLVLMPQQASSLDDLGRVIREQHVTTLWLTAGLFHLMVEQRLEDLRPIRQLLAGGDVLSARHVRLVLENLPDCRLINGYGPTENTTFTCCHTMRHGDAISESIPIGTPISNTQVYILDEHLQPVGPGVMGELYAAGDGLARGYLNNPAETAEKFVPNPFVTETGARMYRTGDLARRRVDGVIEFLGRIDNQIKILGHRVEPGEVESVLGAHAGLKQVCVVSIDTEDGSKRLAAYYVSANDPSVPPDNLRRFLAEKLPQYLVPTYFVPLFSLPLSPNGKVDRAALPPPNMSGTAQAAVEVTATQIEQSIIGVWRQILRVAHIGLDDNFFDLGGDSLQLIAVHSNLQKELRTEIQITNLFEFPTVRALARHLDGATPQRSLRSKVHEQGQMQRTAFARQRKLKSGRAS